MTFFKNIKKSLGFGESDDGYYDNSVSDISEPTHKKNSNISRNQISIPATNTDDAEERIKKMQHDIFSSVVSIFNESLPDFLKSSIDAEAQKKYLYDSLDESLRQYIANVGAETRRICEQQWDNERKSITNELNSIRSQNIELERQKDDWQKQQLSAERQKRALSTRLHDLEARVVSFEAEKEQYELENRSLVNKLKASNVLDADVEMLRQENLKLRQALKNSENEVDNITTESKINELTAQITALSKERDKLNNIIEQLKIKEELSDGIINELNEKASNALRQLEENSTNNISSESLTQKIETLESQLKDSNEKLLESENKLAEANNELQVIEQIQSEIEKFEALQAKKEEKIVELQQTIEFKNARIKELEEDAESLKSTIEKNLYNQAISEDLLKKEIAQLIDSQKSQGKKPRKKQGSSIKISAIDESIVDADWLISIPPEGTAIKSASASNAEEFGYQAPPKKVTPENDAQMSLW